MYPNQHRQRLLDGLAAEAEKHAAHPETDTPTANGVEAQAVDAFRRALYGDRDDEE